MSATTDLHEVIHILATALSDHGPEVTIPPDPDATEHLRILAKAIGATCTAPNCYRARKALGVCGAHYKATQRRAAKIQDAEWIVGTDNPERVAHRLGYSTVDNLRDVLRRWGRADLADRLLEGAA